MSGVVKQVLARHRTGRLLRPVVRAARDVREVAVVLAVAVVVEVNLRRSTLPVTARRLGVVLDLDGGVGEQESGAGRRPVLPATARRQVRAVDLVVGRWPFGDTCLRRCLVLGHRLHRLHPVLVIGVRRTAQGGLAAHSWLVVGGRSLDPAARYFLPMGGRT